MVKELVARLDRLYAYWMDHGASESFKGNADGSHAEECSGTTAREDREVLEVLLGCPGVWKVFSDATHWRMLTW